MGVEKNGRVEIAYLILRDCEGQGMASFACKALLDLVHPTDSTLTVIAKTEPEKNASTKILKKNHFVLTDTVQDEEIGDAGLWTYNKNGER